jgi:histidine ammonia-lyase
MNYNPAQPRELSPSRNGRAGFQFEFGGCCCAECIPLMPPSRLWKWAIRVARKPSCAPLCLDRSAQGRIESGSEFVRELVEREKVPVYGLNTGFGSFAERVIPNEVLTRLQRNLIVSHACAVGTPASRAVIAAMWLLRLRTFASGRTGVSPETVQRILQLLNMGILSLVPSRGSVGASGDLCAGAHASLILLGEGKCTRPTRGNGEFEIVDAGRALAEAGLEPITLQPKEGLALINGTHYTVALACQLWSEADQLLRIANLAAAMSMEAMGGAGAILRDNVLATHHRQTEKVGHQMSAWLDGSEYLQGAKIDRRFFQAPYCLRCAPQVHGAVALELEQTENMLQEEFNAVCDNPLLFPETKESHSCGNFHAIYPARVCDRLASALTTLGNISERRINMAMDERLSGLPTFLVNGGGLNSGLMMVQVTAAALVSECKSLSFPASVDSIPTNCDREDHVSMGPGAALKALQIAGHVRSILAIELMVAAQALDLRSDAISIPPALRTVHGKLRRQVKFLKEDRVLSNDIESIRQMIAEGGLIPEA